MTGSVLVPIKALVMNTLSLGATFGALVWIFQDGHLSGLLGFHAFGAIEVWVPVVVFVFAFGLSMDYEVFLLSRIKECYDECGDTNTAVANGLQRSGRIITSAAALVMIVFLGFAAGRALGIKEMGLALAIAVAVDATLVRCLLVPGDDDPARRAPTGGHPRRCAACTSGSGCVRHRPLTNPPCRLRRSRHLSPSTGTRIVRCPWNRPRTTTRPWSAPAASAG